MTPAVAEDYRTVRLSITARRPYGREVNTAEAESIAELIDDCAQLPTTLRGGDLDYPRRAAADPLDALPWQVSDGCFAQVSGLDEYV
jgi:hypothetical protein